MSASSTAALEISGGERFHQCERTACREIDGKAIVITIDRNQLHVLNGVGTRVWQLLDGRPLTAIVDIIVEEFEVERERASRDVQAFALRLYELGATRLARGEG
jgi:hypothetical protein